MAPEYGATCGFFPFDGVTLDYMRKTSRPAEVIDRCERYYKAQGLWRTDDMADPIFTDTVELDLATVEPNGRSQASPRSRPAYRDAVELPQGPRHPGQRARLWPERYRQEQDRRYPACQRTERAAWARRDPDCAITSCTNTSNATVLIAAGLVAKKAVEAGLTVRRTSRPAWHRAEVLN